MPTLILSLCVNPVDHLHLFPVDELQHEITALSFQIPQHPHLSWQLEYLHLPHSWRWMLEPDVRLLLLCQWPIILFRLSRRTVLKQWSMHKLLFFRLLTILHHKYLPALLAHLQQLLRPIFNRMPFVQQSLSGFEQWHLCGKLSRFHLRLQ